MSRRLTDEERQRVIAAAQTWVGTPYHHAGRIKGAGVDCAMLLCEAYEEAGIVGRVVPSAYPPEWHFHRDAERYLEHLKQFADEMPEGTPILPADVLVVKFGRTFSHGVIVIRYPLCIHAYFRERVGYVDVSNEGRFLNRPIKHFALKAED